MPTLTVALVVKDEQRNLPRALTSVAPVADEIVVTDTGSSDRTVEIAREFGAKVSQFKWIDDFSAAHNHCNSLATSDWILMLDADEELLAESREELARCLTDDRVLAYFVIRQDLTNEQQLDHFAEMSQLRLFRNRPELRFVGRFHHQPSPSLAKAATRDGLEFRDSQIRLRHYGYLSNLKPDKNRRAVRLLELELADRPGQFYYLVELGATLLAIGESDGHQKLHQAAQMVVDDDPQVAGVRGSLAILLEYILANPKLPTGFPLSKQQSRQMALERFPDSVPLLWHLAAEENRSGQHADCARFLERIIKLGKDHSYDRTVSFDPAIMRDDAKLNLGVCYVRMEKVHLAEGIFRELLDSPARSREASDNLRLIRNLRAK